MSAFVGAVTIFNALAFVLVGLAFATDSVRSVWSRRLRAAQLPSAVLTDDERLLTTVAAPNPGVVVTGRADAAKAA